MKPYKLEAIVSRMLENIAKIRFGNVSVSLKLHDGRIVEVTHLTAEQTKEPKENLEKDD